MFNAANQLYAGPGKLYPVDEIRWEETVDFEEWLAQNGGEL